MGRRRSRSIKRELVETAISHEQYFTNEHIRYTAEAYNIPVEDDPDEGDWLKSGVDPLDKYQEPQGREDIVKHIRRLARLQPNVKSSLRYYQSFTFGRDFAIGLKLLDPSERATAAQKKVMLQARRLWNEFVLENHRQWTVKELGLRCWRDGEQFTRKFGEEEWPPRVRFVDPEIVKDLNNPATHGIITDPNDVVTPITYRMVDLVAGEQLEDVPAEQIFHSKIDCDVNEKRGTSRYLPVVRWVRKFWGLLEIELKHRMQQASLVMQRKIRGGQGQVRRHLDHSSSASNGSLATGDHRREKILGGSIINTSEGVEIEFLQPQSNFSDATPLAKLLMMQISVSTGFPYYLISGDAGDSNLSGNLVQESPIALMIDDERSFFSYELSEIFRWVMDVAIAQGKISPSIWDEFQIDILWPSIVTRDMLKEAQALNIARMASAISRQEFSRRMMVDPDQMQQEIEQDMENMIVGPQGDVSAMNQNNATKAGNQAANQGTGTNQGDGKPIQHKDNQTGVST